MIEPAIELLGSYGLDKDYEYQEQGLGLKILKKLRHPFNLNLTDGYEGNNDQAEDLYVHSDKMGNTLTWMVDHRELLEDGNNNCHDKPFNVDIVCSNGLFSWILTSAFNNDKRQVIVTKFKGILFIKRVIETQFGISDKHVFAGNKFRELMMDKIDPEDGCLKYYNVMKAKIGDHSMVYACEVDCTKDQLEGVPTIDDFVELRTSNAKSFFHLQNPKLYSPFFRRTKSRQWWSQLVMTGIKQFIIGIKVEERGEIRCRKIHKMTIKDIVKAADGWLPEVSILALDMFLKQVKHVVTEDNPEIVHLFTIEGYQVTSEKLNVAENVNFEVLTKEMIEKLNQISNCN